MPEWTWDAVLVLGLALVAVGAGLLALWLGVLVAGLELALLGYILGAEPAEPAKTSSRSLEVM